MKNSRKDIQDRIAVITGQITTHYLDTVVLSEEERIQWKAVVKTLNRYKILLAGQKEKEIPVLDAQSNLLEIYPRLRYTSNTSYYADFKHVYLLR